MSNYVVVVPDDIPDDWEPEGVTIPEDDDATLPGDDHTLVPPETFEEDANV